jgi:hypothetical protein
MLRDIRIQSESQIGAFDALIAVGRPVRYSNADTEEDNEFAVDRLKLALKKAGIGPVIFEYEPVAAPGSQGRTVAEASNEEIRPGPRSVSPLEAEPCPLSLQTGGPRRTRSRSASKDKLPISLSTHQVAPASIKGRTA